MEDLHEEIPRREPEPCWRYRSDGEGGIEKQLFQHPDNVPGGQGWKDSPAYFKDAPASVHAETGALSGMGWKDLRAAYKEKFGKGVGPGMTREDVLERLQA